MAMNRESPRTEHRTVMVVEDQPDLLELLSELLSDDGYQVVPATDGEAAVHLARTCHPALILLDLMLPRKSGIEVLADLGSNPRTRQIPVVVVSAHSRYLRPPPQVKAVVQKPFDVWHLLHVVNELAESQRRAA